MQRSYPRGSYSSAQCGRASGGISGLHVRGEPIETITVVSTIGGVGSDGGCAPFVMIAQLSDRGLL